MHFLRNSRDCLVLVVVIQLHSNRPMKRAGEAGKALRAGGGADFIFSASERVVTAFSLPVGGVGVSAGCFVRW